MLSDPYGSVPDPAWLPGYTWYDIDPRTIDPGDGVAVETYTCPASGEVFQELTGLLQPLWRSGGGEPYFEFDGIDDVLPSVNEIDLGGTAGFSWIVVAKIRTYDGAAGYFAHRQPSPPSPDFTVCETYYTGGPSTPVVVSTVNRATSLANISGAGPAIGTRAIVIGTHRASPPDVGSLRSEETEVSNTYLGGGDTYPHTGGIIYVGHGYSADTSYLDLYRLMFCTPALTDADILTLEGILTDAHGL